MDVLGQIVESMKKPGIHWNLHEGENHRVANGEANGMHKFPMCLREKESLRERNFLHLTDKESMRKCERKKEKRALVTYSDIKVGK